MAKSTSNKSMHTKRPTKAQRRVSPTVGETDESARASGASGQARRKRRPGRAASLLTIAATKRSNRWRNPEKGGSKRRRGTLAKKSFAGRSRASLAQA